MNRLDEASRIADPNPTHNPILSDRVHSDEDSRRCSNTIYLYRMLSRINEYLSHSEHLYRAQGVDKSLVFRLPAEKRSERLARPCQPAAWLLFLESHLRDITLARSLAHYAMVRTLLLERPRGKNGSNRTRRAKKARNVPSFRPNDYYARASEKLIARDQYEKAQGPS